LWNNASIREFIHQVRYIYWWVEAQQRMAAPLVEKLLRFLAALHTAALLKTALGKVALLRKLL
jgi:hypothetical protein